MLLFSKSNFLKNYFRILSECRVQARCFVGPDLGPKCYGYQQTTLIGRVKHGIYLKKWNVSFTPQNPENLNKFVGT